MEAGIRHHCCPKRAVQVPDPKGIDHIVLNARSLQHFFSLTFRLGRFVNAPEDGGGGSAPYHLPPV